MVRMGVYKAVCPLVFNLEKADEKKKMLRDFAVELVRRVPLSLEDRDRPNTITVYGMDGREERFRISVDPMFGTDFYTLHQNVRRAFGIPLRSTAISIALCYQRRWPSSVGRWGHHHFKLHEPMAGYSDILIPAFYRGTVWQLCKHE